MTPQSRKRKRDRADQALHYIHENGRPRPAAVPSKLENALCARCSSIGLKNIFAKESTEKTGTLIVDIGRITSDWLEASCPFCRFLAQILFLSGNEDVQDNGEISLRAFPAIIAIGNVISSRNSRFMPKTSDTSVLGLVKSIRFNSQRAQLDSQEVLSKWGYIYPDTISKPSARAQILGRVIKPDVIDYALIKSWINFCTSHHVSTCRILEDTNIPTLRVIDCFSRKVVEAPKDCKYVAMSYVWGQKGMNADWSLSSSDSNTIPEELPAVIEDAMTVVRELGLNYLWVDRYTILQDSKEDVIRHMNVMDLIYNHAYITIVAAAGSDPFYGLPGVGSRHRLPQQSVRIGNQTILSTLSDVQEQVKTSTWMTRAWVYQEALFSVRRLIFTEHQVYFECNNMHCCEAVDVPLEPFHTKNLRRYRTCVRHGVFRGGFGKRCWPLTSHIQKYTEKSLTYQTDILRGMLGIFRAFEAAKYPIHHAWGVPIEFDMDLVLWKKQATINKQYFSFPWRLSAGFARGLCWLPKYPAARRLDFPSWSWTGWGGPIQEWPSFETLSAQENPDIEFSVTLEDGHVANLHELYTFTGSKTAISRTSCYLEVDAWTFQIRITPVPSKRVSESTLETGRSEKEARDYYAKVELEDETTVYSPLVLSRLIQHGDKFSQDFTSRKWDCIILGYRKQASKSPMVMVIEESEDGAERFGLVDFWNSITTIDDPKSIVIFDDRKLSKVKRKLRLK